MVGVDERAPEPGGQSELRIIELPDRVGLELVGAVDLSTRGDFERSLTPLVSRGTDVHLEMSRLVFCDVAAAAVLVTAADCLPPGRRLVLRQPPQTLRRALELFWPHVPTMEVAS
ncbi:STAS domain-containing protein [Actinomycetes bacterium KLBMP 9797]